MKRIQRSKREKKARCFLGVLCDSVVRTPIGWLAFVLFLSLALHGRERQVEITQDSPLVIYADSFEIAKRKDGSEVGEWKGNVRLEHAEYRMRADRLQAFKKQMEGIATGNVELKNAKEGISLTSDRLFYRDDFEYVELTGEPYLVRVDEKGLTTTARSKRMEFFQREDRGRLLGDVEIVQGELKVRCEEAVLYNQEDKLVLNGDPVAQQQDTYFSGRKMVFYIEEDRLQIEGDVQGELYPEEESETANEE